MSDWQVGDLALCMRGVIPKNGDPVIAPGSLHTVKSVTQGRTKRGLLLLGVPTRNPFGYAAYRFIKVTPPAADAFDREVIEQMTGAPQEVSP